MYSLFNLTQVCENSSIILYHRMRVLKSALAATCLLSEQDSKLRKILQVHRSIAVRRVTVGTYASDVVISIPEEEHRTCSR